MEYDKILAERAHKAIYLKDGLVYKVFDAEYKKSDVLNEALNQSRVEETGLPIPKILEVGVFDGKWAIVYEFIAGRTLAELMDQNPEKLEEYLTQFVDIQLLMHTKKAPLLTMIKDKMHRKIDESGLDATTRYELHTRLNSMPDHNKVCHGDFNPHNIIINEGGDFSILDWSHATQGNASADAARTFLLFNLEGKPELAEKYLHRFCKKSDTAMQYVQKWIPIVACSQLVKGRPKERELLLHWASVVEYE